MTIESVLVRARELKFLGPLPLSRHLANGRDFAEIIAPWRGDDEAAPLRLADLGSGGGVPALVIADLLADVEVVLLERGERRAGFLTESARQLGFDERVGVVETEVELVARAEGFEAGFDVVTARSFGPPAVVAECACRLLVPGGHLVVSEPPEDDVTLVRWQADALAETGLETIERHRTDDGTYQVLRRTGTPSDRLPRTPGAVRKRPLW